jgi:hypothetical protein
MPKSTMIAIVLCLQGCGQHFNKKAIQGAVVDCAKQDTVKLQEITAELAPLVFGFTPDWKEVRARTQKAGVALGGCVLAKLVNDYLARPRALENSESAYSVLEKFRADNGNVSWLIDGLVQ